LAPAFAVLFLLPMYFCLLFLFIFICLPFPALRISVGRALHDLQFDQWGYSLFLLCLSFLSHSLFSQQVTPECFLLHFYCIHHLTQNKSHCKINADRNENSHIKKKTKKRGEHNWKLNLCETKRNWNQNQNETAKHVAFSLRHSLFLLSRSARSPLFIADYIMRAERTNGKSSGGRPLTNWERRASDGELGTRSGEGLSQVQWSPAKKY